MKTAIFYGSTTGTTAAVAKRIARAAGVADSDIFDVAKADPAKLGEYDLLILGTPTWGSGELQDDWYDFVAGAEALDMTGKKIALFGCGDETMSGTFCSAVGELYDRMVKTGAKFVGSFTAAPYDYNSSDAVRGNDNIAVGLLLDEVNHPELTDARIAEWVKTIK
ncbi:MAG: flavodoxin [Bacteroidales bacterium]|nr:flavodoxin [Bacteroidales bacterium]